MDAVGIEDIEIVVPKCFGETNKDLEEIHGFDPSFIRDKLGIRSRSVLCEGQSPSDLAVLATEKLLRPHEDRLGKIELVIVVTQTSDLYLPHVAAIVHGALMLPKNVMAFDIGLGCSGYVTGLQVAKAVMNSEGFANGLLITVDAYSRIVDKSDRATAPIFGDAATATLLSRRPCYWLGRAVSGTDGSKHKCLIAGRETDNRLRMDGRAIFDFMMREVPTSIEACLRLNGLNIEQIDAFIFHQASRYMLRALSSTLKIDSKRLIEDFADIGNTTSSSIPIALKRVLLNGDHRPEKILLCGFGVGLSWGSTVIIRSEKRGGESEETFG